MWVAEAKTTCHGGFFAAFRPFRSVAERRNETAGIGVVLSESFCVIGYAILQPSLHGIIFANKLTLSLNYILSLGWGFLFERSQIEHISVKLRASPADGGLIIKDRYYHLRKYHSSFVGEFIISQMKSDKKPNVTLLFMYHGMPVLVPTLAGVTV